MPCMNIIALIITEIDPRQSFAKMFTDGRPARQMDGRMETDTLVSPTAVPGETKMVLENV